MKYKMKNNRRSSDSEPQGTLPKSNTGLKKMLTFFQSSFFKDVLSKRYHSHDFRETRADYIAGRLKIMAMAFAILVPASVVLDLILLPDNIVATIFTYRLVLAISLIIVAVIAHTKKSSHTIEWLLPLSFLLPSLFYFASMVVITQAGVTINIGFSFIPFLCAAMMGLYPMTIITCAIVTSMIFVPTISVDILNGTVFTVETANKVWAFFMFIGISWWVQTGQLLMLMKLYRESTQDPLTGLMNRRVLMRHLESKKFACDESLLANNRANETFSILMCDLDRFKRINDSYGHLTGDSVLKVVANMLQNQLREQDLIARFGGEEFVVVLPELSISEAITVAERIRIACSKLDISADNGEKIITTISIGVTQYQHQEAVLAMFERVDDLLYTAKKEGRNKVSS